MENWKEKNNIRDGGGTVVWTAYTAYLPSTAHTPNTVWTTSERKGNDANNDMGQLFAIDTFISILTMVTRNVLTKALW